MLRNGTLEYFGNTFAIVFKIKKYLNNRYLAALLKTNSTYVKYKEI